MTAPRRVAPVPEVEAAVLADLAAASVDCLDGVDMLLEELETADPSADERCGLLDGRHEVYVLRIPRCARMRLAISIDRARGGFGPVAVHGLVPSTARPCDASRMLAERHLRLIAPAWETT
jgi:hypothetical protein